MIFILTYLGYASLHMVREAWSILKSELDKDYGFSPKFLGAIDTTFLFVYSLCLFVAGVLGDKFNLKKVVVIGMILSSVCVTFMGLGGIWNIHAEAYFLVLFALNGVFQSVGWPCDVAIMGNWFPKNRRGFIIGMWSSCASFGNILGAQVTNICVTLFGFDWKWTMLINAMLFFVVIALNFLLLVESPQKIGIDLDAMYEGAPDEAVAEQVNNENSILRNDMERAPQHTTQIEQGDVAIPIEKPKKAISFFSAWLIPGVLAYSVSYACLKLTNYGITYWVAKYCQDELGLTISQATTVATLYEVGTIIGSIFFGYLSDLLGKRAPIIVATLIVATIGHVMLIIFESVAGMAYLCSIFILLGLMVGSASNIISATCCADLGKNEDLKSDDQALATVTGIVDGTGSFGAAVGQYLIGWLQEKSWNSVFIMLTITVVLSMLSLTNLFIKEVKELFNESKTRSRRKSSTILAKETKY